jgi:hypothetical protein
MQIIADTTQHNTIMSSSDHQPQKKQRYTLDKRDLTDAELKKYGKTLWPATPVEDLKELTELMECQFCQYPEGSDDDEDDGEGGDADTDEQWKNFSAYVRKVGGFGWINALHAFNDHEDGKPVSQTALTYVLDGDPEEWRFVSFLLQMGADPNVRNSRGEPPLFVFMNSGSPMKRFRTFSFLMDAGACEKAVFGGKTMVEFAKMFKDNDQVSQMVYDDFDRKHGLSNASQSLDESDDYDSGPE